MARWFFVLISLISLIPPSGRAQDPNDPCPPGYRKAGALDTVTTTQAAEESDIAKSEKQDEDPDSAEFNDEEDLEDEELDEEAAAEKTKKKKKIAPAPKPKKNVVGREVAPTSPNAPGSFSVPTQIKDLGCERVFKQEEKLVSVDSYYRRDGEHLRPYLEDLPEATHQLNIYQSRRHSAKIAAYTGTLGIAIFVASIFLKNRYDEGEVLHTTFKHVGLFGGLGLAAGSFAYSFGVLQTNEKHLNNAVKIYNDAHPDNPIEVEVSTGFSF